jgi:sigma-B regulation protein RsbU (phosphoserine phosphatase)
MPALAPELTPALTRVLETGEPVIDEVAVGEAPTAPGRSRFWRASYFPVRGDAGDTIAIGAVISEITDQRAQEAATRAHSDELEKLFEQEREIADTLERSLLPDQLPQLDRLGLAARLLPAGERYQVGGDFYEVFEARGSLFMVLGDVAGKGPGAATITALVRHVFRALSLYEDRPAMILARLRDALLAHRDRESLVTVVCAVIRHPKRARHITIATAGHPLPLRVTRRGRVEEVGAANPLLPVTDGEFAEQRVRLRSKDRLFFYTDGLSEARAPQHMLSVEELGGALAGRENLALERLLDNVVTWALSGRPQRDDIALLAIERR